MTDDEQKKSLIEAGCALPKKLLKGGLFSLKDHLREFGQGMDVGFLDKNTIRIQYYGTSSGIVVGHHF